MEVLVALHPSTMNRLRRWGHTRQKSWGAGVVVVVSFSRQGIDEQPISDGVQGLPCEGRVLRLLHHRQGGKTGDGHHLIRVGLHTREGTSGTRGSERGGSMMRMRMAMVVVGGVLGDGRHGGGVPCIVCQGGA